MFWLRNKKIIFLYAPLSGSLITHLVNVLKFHTHFSLSSQTKCWLSGLELGKCLLEDPDQMLLQKQSDLSVQRLIRLSWQATGDQSFRAVTQHKIQVTGENNMSKSFVQYKVKFIGKNYIVQDEV